MNKITRPCADPYLPQAATIIARQEHSPSIFSVDLELLDASQQQSFLFSPGQFNMLSLPGVGEVAISISSDPANRQHLTHIIRAVGRVTKAMQKSLQIGDEIGLRGPYGQGWPLDAARGKEVVIVTGGLGCAPSVSAINYMLARRKEYGAIKILQGVKHSDDLILKQQYNAWQKAPNTEVFIAADVAGPHWPWSVGYVTDSIQGLQMNPANTIVMMCGPEGMMKTAVPVFIQRGIAESDIYLSMERNMVCGIGHCGHCMFGGLFICKDGPVLAYPKIKSLLFEAGF